MHVGARSLSQLRAVFGDCVPEKNAAALLEASPAAPSSPAELQALREALTELAGQKLDVLASRLGASPGPVGGATTGSKAAALQARQVQASRELRTPEGLQKVLQLPQVEKIFAAAAAMRDIPWGFLEEGCLHRSHVLARRLEDDGVWCEKIFTIPRGGDLVMESDKAKLGFTVCWYHEAVVVHVQTTEGLERRVIDPSVGDGPLTVDAWLATMHGTNDAPLETFYLPRFAYGLSARNDPPTEWNATDLATASSWGDEWRAVEKSLEEMDFYAQLKELAGR